MKKGLLIRLIGFGVFCFGAGILTSFLLPDNILAFLEALVIIGVGMIYYSQR